MGQQSNTIAPDGEHAQPEHMRPHFSGKPVIAGHTPQTSGETLDLGFLKLIDTDCSRGKWLTALDVRDEVVNPNKREGEVRSKILIKGSGPAAPRCDC